MTTHPKLRDLQPTPATHGGRKVIYLQDPLRLASKTVLIPIELAPMLRLLDGSRDLSEIREALRFSHGIDLSEDDLARWLEGLDQACLLENEHSAEALAAKLEHYRQGPSRPAVMAGEVYPEDPEELRRTLEEALATAEKVASERPPRGLISPHIDFDRGISVYAATWASAAEAVQEAELLIVLGTDHAGEDELVTLTRLPYETPLGRLPTDDAALAALVEAIGEAEVFRGELRHATEHSIELAALWAQVLRGDEPLPMLPILCGPADQLVGQAGRPAIHRALGPLLESLRRLLITRRALIVAAGDLSHVGRAFGDPPVDPVTKAEVQQADGRLLACLQRGDAQSFLGEIVAMEDRHHVCGTTPIYLALMALAPVRARIVGHAFCPADEGGTSWVTICGALLG